jgi:uncharacterized protein YeaO (DUF488 family)
VRRLIDVRLNNTSQLAAFTKRQDIEFFLREILDADYLHEPRLSPRKDILDAFKKKEMPWEEYENRFRAMLAENRPETFLDREDFATPTVLLCSESEPDHCHRRLVAEHLAKAWENVTVTHL